MPVDKLLPQQIAESFRGKVTTQSYEKKKPIEGVQRIDLRIMADEGGSFAELIRLDEQGNLLQIPTFKVRQSSYSQMLPGAIKAFHMHYNQEDVWFIPPTDRLLVGLLDARAGSPTAGVSMRFVMGAGRAQLLYIPRGVAHGAANIGQSPMTILYFVNQHFNLDEPDERRLPYDILGREFWEIEQG